MTTDLWIRAASRDDAAEVVTLLAHLGYLTDAKAVMARLWRLEETGLDQVLVAEQNERVVGVISLHITPALLHQDSPACQITALAVDEQESWRGIGHRLVAAAEELARNAGCASIEVSSNKRRIDTHLFYEAIGYTRTSELFRKHLL